MKLLYQRLKDYNFKDAIEIEENDRQFLALKKLWEYIADKEIYLLLVVANSLICYQLSWKWEDYWEEFSEYFSKIKINKIGLIIQLIEFLKQSKNNKRLLDIKINRIKKLENFINNFEWKWEFFYKNMLNLRDKLALNMRQKNNSKTIVFAIKMFWYWARNFFEFVEYPKEIFIPIDSRLIKLFEKYKWNYIDINKFYLDLSKKLNISMLHLDWIIRTLYNELIKD